MNCGPCCIPGCPDAEEDTCVMGGHDADETRPEFHGHMLCYRHASQIELTPGIDWPTQEASINAQVARMVAEAKEKLPPVQLKRVGGYT